MSAKKKTQSTGLGVNFAVTAVTIGVVFVFVGYLIGQYAVGRLQQRDRHSTQFVLQPVEVPAVAPSPAPVAPAPRPVAPSVSIPATQEQATILYRVQVGVFSEKTNAERLAAQLGAAGYEALIIPGPPHRVQTGAFSSEENAARLMDELKAKGFEAIIVR